MILFLVENHYIHLYFCEMYNYIDASRSMVPLEHMVFNPQRAL